MDKNWNLKMSLSKGYFCFPTIGLYHSQDGASNPRFKLMHFLTNKIFLQREEDTSF